MAIFAPDEPPPELERKGSEPSLAFLDDFRLRLETAQRQLLQCLDEEIGKARQTRESADRLDELCSSMTSVKFDSHVNIVGEHRVSHCRSLGAHDMKTQQQQQQSLYFSEDDNMVDIVPQRRENRSRTAQSNRSSGNGQHLLPSLQPKRKRRKSWLTKRSNIQIKENRKTAKSVESHKPNVLSMKVPQSSDNEGDGDADAKQEKMAQGLFGKMRRASIDSPMHPGVISPNLAVHHSHRADNCCYSVSRHPWFERLTMLIIMLNAAELALSAELNTKEDQGESHAVFIISENIFCAYFLAEIIIRFFSYAKWLYALQDIWFAYDLALLLMMVTETWILPLVFLIISPTNNILQNAGVLRVTRVLRVLRTARMVRLVRTMPELMILIKGMMVACRSVFFTLLLLFIITFVFSIAFVEFCRGTPLEDMYFDSLAQSVATLTLCLLRPVSLLVRLVVSVFLLCESASVGMRKLRTLECIFTDQQHFVRRLTEQSVLHGLLVMLFILLGSMTVMNMLLGILVEAVKAVSAIEQEQLVADFAKRVLWELIDKDDHDEEDDDRMISEEEFTHLLCKPKAVKALSRIGVDASAALANAKLLFEDGESITFHEFMHAMLTLRLSNTTTVKDIIELRKYVAEEFSEMQTLINELCSFIADTWDDSRRPSPSSSLVVQRLN
ncbi:unnamed protein product [Effrenium voratum]|nr:unnamed protein product [Effrenium voratum]